MPDEVRVVYDGQERKAGLAVMVEAPGAQSVAAAFTAGQNALSTSAEVVIASNTARKFASVNNTDGAIAMYIGKDATVTTANGYLLKAGATLDINGYSGPVWAIAASGTPILSFIEW